MRMWAFLKILFYVRSVQSLVISIATWSVLFTIALLPRMGWKALAVLIGAAAFIGLIVVVLFLGWALEQINKDSQSE